MLFDNQNVTVMGLGVNLYGSGVSGAQYLAKNGANLTITDLRSAEALAETIDSLKKYSIKKYVLGRHDMADFTEADFVLKNPGVKRSSPYLLAAKRVETDLSLFLDRIKNPLVAITGSKGKSSTTNLIYDIMGAIGAPVRTGGNIGMSPLNYIDEVTYDETLVFELSSWQAGDLAGRRLLKPYIAGVLNLLPDHQNYYEGDMEAYAEDKAAVLDEQDESCFAILNADDKWTPFFSRRGKARKAYFGTDATALGRFENFVCYDENNRLSMRIHGREDTMFAPYHHSLVPANLAAATLALRLLGVTAETIEGAVRGGYKGVPHRLELVRELNGVQYYNDTTATIPQAVNLAMSRFSSPIRLIFGGADKEIEFESLVPALTKAKSLYLLDGTARTKIERVLTATGLQARGPFSSMEDAVAAAKCDAVGGDVVLLSPGAASFGLFTNEFDRGNRFKEAVMALK